MPQAGPARGSSDRFGVRSGDRRVRAVGPEVARPDWLPWRRGHPAKHRDGTGPGPEEECVESAGDATKAALLEALDAQRAHILGALDGLDPVDLHRPVLPSG